MYKLAIIGASYLQVPLINTAKDMGIETHVFAWAAGDVGEKLADFFYPISIIEKEQILEKCLDIGINGICSISSDLAMITVNYVANAMGLTGNSPKATLQSTNKHAMRLCFEWNGDPSPKSIEVDKNTSLNELSLTYPVIVKPVDRSGSRGITKITEPDSVALIAAVNYALQQGFEKKALIEEFVDGKEYSVEYLTFKGEHHFLNITEKFTTGAPSFIETGHFEPAELPSDISDKIRRTVTHALTSLGIEYGASHSEVKIDSNGNIKIIEIGGRMGGDFIGSHLVPITTGVDYVKAVIEIALGWKPSLIQNQSAHYAAVKYFFTKEDVEKYRQFKQAHMGNIVTEYFSNDVNAIVTDSSNRPGCAVLKSDDKSLVLEFLSNSSDDNNNHKK